MIWEAYGTSDSSIYSSVIDVYANRDYSLQVEVLRSGLGDATAMISSIKVDGIYVGQCNPDGSDTDCDFFNCGSAIGSKVFSSKTGKLSVELEYDGNSAECYCDTSNWKCSSAADSLFKTDIVAAAQITLTPWGRLNLMSLF